MNFKNFILIGLIFVGIVACSGDYEKDKFYEDPTLTQFQPDEVFIVAQESKSIDGTPMGRVIIERQDDGTLCSAILLTHKIIPKGKQVELWKLQYRHNLGMSNTFMFVR